MAFQFPVIVHEVGKAYADALCSILLLYIWKPSLRTQLKTGGKKKSAIIVLKIVGILSYKLM